MAAEHTFSFSDHEYALEMNRLYERNIERNKMLLLLLGPSAVGKSVIIDGLKASTEHTFEYVKTIMTRPLRDAETDKVSVPDECFTRMKESGDFLVVNSNYGVRYGTPLRGVLEPIAKSIIPVLDFPLERIDMLQRPEYEIMSVYVYPPSIDEWVGRLESSERNIGGRYEDGAKELTDLALRECIHPAIDISVVNRNGEASAVVDSIVQTISTVTRST